MKLRTSIIQIIIFYLVIITDLELGIELFKKSLGIGEDSMEVMRYFIIIIYIYFLIY
ncbi:hypothetical protein RhiirC2_186224 [Rhizophagus irregularis]|uniref:Uncharacterized protein n=1 Tax=Rhizophagus irregularis TaxID=588596 RepID=A0A2N1P4E8_9GLOM|nr:hypothetical protein RhiirC2_186224 [Rhizophagus irregularis]